MSTTEMKTWSTDPKPSRSMIVSSVLVIGVSIVLASILLRVVIAGQLNLNFLLPIVVGMLQYAACFRRNFIAAKLLFYFHMLGIIASTVLGVLCLLFSFHYTQMRPKLLVIFVISSFLAILAAVSMWNVLHWADQLAAARFFEPEDLFRKKRPFQLSIHELLLAMTVVAIIAGLISSMIHMGFLTPN